jgi:hypothetical protein
LCMTSLTRALIFFELIKPRRLGFGIFIIAPVLWRCIGSGHPLERVVIKFCFIHSEQNFLSAERKGKRRAALFSLP